MSILGLGRDRMPTDEKPARAFSPAVQEHIDAIEALHEELEVMKAKAESYRRGVEDGINEIRGLKTELETLRRMADAEVVARRHFEKQARTLTVSLGNLRTLLDQVFVDAKAQMALTETELVVVQEKLPSVVTAGPRDGKGD